MDNPGLFEGSNIFRFKKFVHDHDTKYIQIIYCLSICIFRARLYLIHMKLKKKTAITTVVLRFEQMGIILGGLDYPGLPTI